jgi:hypothetical protein
MSSVTGLLILSTGTSSWSYREALTVKDATFVCLTFTRLPYDMHWAGSYELRSTFKVSRSTGRSHASSQADTTGVHLHKHITLSLLELLSISRLHKFLTSFAFAVACNVVPAGADGTK